jgi:hypothetical protein
MKKIFGCLSLGLFLAAVVGSFATNSSAQIIAQDDASSYSNAPANAAWLSGPNTNGGFGFTPWVFQKAGTGAQGFFIGNPGGIGSTNAKAWGQYANEGGNQANFPNASVAFRGFSNSLAADTVFSIKWQNHGIGEFNANDPLRLGGFALRNGNANGSTNDFNTGARFLFYYIGGGQDAFVIQDGNGNTATSLGFGANPFTIEFTLLTQDTYRLVIKDATGVNILAEYDNNPLAGSGTIDSLSTFAINTGGDQVWNNLRIFSASLTPPIIDNLQPTNGSIYAGTEAPFSFNVTSVFSTVASNGVQLTLNGVQQTNLSFTGSGTTNLGVTLFPLLQSNVLYNGTIIATDANGNHATNNFTFNTWLATDYFIEASDYNFSSGIWINAPQPNQDYAGLLGSNGIDYLEFDLSGTNNAYRPGDLPQIEAATDLDHNAFVANGLQPYNLAFIQNAEWENYTRNLGNTNYLVYARMSGFGANPVMEMDNLANATATTSNQPLAALGTFVCPNTGGPQDWTFVPLKDFFSNPVLVNFGTTNTTRLACVGSSGSINVAYLIFVPQTNGPTLRPYLSAGFPFPNAVNAAPDGQIHFTIANRQTSVSPGTIQLFLNSNNVTASISLSNNGAGTVVAYQSPTLLPPGTNTLQAIFSDGTVTQTNTWQFTVANLPIINPGWALPLGAGSGHAFSIHITKAPDDSPAGDFSTTIAQALAQLAGTLTNSSSLLPYTNIAGGPNGDGLYTESNTINYDITGAPTGGFTFNFKTNFPYVPAAQTNNYIAMAVDMYLALTPGVYTFAVRSDDGFLLTAGPTPTSTNLTLGLFGGGRDNGTPSQFDFIVQTNGLYPMQLIYFQGQFGGSIEFYSVNRTNGTSTLINDQTSPNSIRAFLLGIVPIPLAVQKVGGNVVLSWSNPSFNLQASPAVNSGYTNVPGATSPYTNSITGPASFFRLIH